MKLRKLILAIALAGAASGAAQASPYVGSLNTGAAYDGLLAGVTGVDIFSNGAAAFFCASAAGCGANAFGSQLSPVSGGALGVGSIITTVYQGVVNVINPGIPSPQLEFPGSSAAGNLYQLTVSAIFNEVVVAENVAFGTAILAVLDGGRVSLFYDNNGGALPGTLIDTAAEIAAGVGYTDGILLLDGDTSQALSLLTQISTNGVIASGSANINGLVSGGQLGSVGDNIVGFIPVPGDFESTTTLQFGPNINGYQTSNFFDNANGWVSVAVNSALTERADANVDLSAVPEPGTLALLGIALAGLGAGVRRRRAA